MITVLVLCAIGTEKILSNEIKKLGYTAKILGPGRVISTCPLDGLYELNVCLRTADKIYIQLSQFSATDFDALFDGVFALNWQDYFYKDTRVIVDKIRVHRSQLSSEHSIQSIVHKAIYKKLGSVWNIEVFPESGASANVRIYIEYDTVSVLLDTSGTPLYQRGYRSRGGAAPIRESLAAALLHMALWRRKIPLYDPLCGSGTFATEATLFAYNIAPGLGRNFAFEHFAFFNQSKYQQLRKKEAAKIRTDVEVRIQASDIDEAAVKRAELNAEHACVMAGRALQLVGSDMKIKRPIFFTSDFRNSVPPYENGLLLTNPPYGERMGEYEEVKTLYADMNILFEKFLLWDKGFIVAHNEFEQSLGHKASNIKAIKSGKLDTKFYFYKFNEA